MPDGAIARTTVDLEAGLALLKRIEEVPEDDASGEVLRTYEDIQETLRVPFVNALFRVLAGGPPFLVPAWRAVGPLVGTVTFEERADRLRHFAAERIGTVADDLELELPDADMLQVRDHLDSLHYVLPKLALTAELFDRVAADETRGSIDWSKDTLPRGAAKGTRKVPLLQDDAVSGAVRKTFKEVQRTHDHPLVASAFRGLANWPLALQMSWGTLAPVVGTDRFLDDRAAVAGQAHDLVQELRLARPDWDDAGVTARDRREARDVLAVFRQRLVPDLLLDVTLIKAHLDGSDGVGRSRFSAARPSPRQPSGPRPPPGKG